ncbi:hypothetical protein V2J09_006874 [Rumex salicifolius]
MAESSVEEPLIEVDPPPPEPKDDEQELEKSLRRLESFLRWFGFCQYSASSISLSWLSFLLIGVVIPVLVIEFYYCYSDCEKYLVKTFELEILFCSTLVAAVSLLCVSHNLRKYGVRKFLFVDKCHGHSAQYRDQYVKKINGFFRLLVIWLLPCFMLKVVKEIVRVIYVPSGYQWEAAITLFPLLISWTYTATIYFVGNVLFNLVCNLQVLHFENYGQLLERDLDVSVYIEEHMRLTFYLSKISHRFRIFLILEFLVVTASECMALLETTANHDSINFINGAEFAISSIVQVVGITICLQAATRISHRAQGLASVVSRWHALVTANSSDASQHGASTNCINSNCPNPSVRIAISFSDSDVESDYITGPTNMQLASYMSTYHKRQAFVLYIQSNPGGVTIFGWRIDRALITTIFFVELSLFCNVERGRQKSLCFVVKTPDEPKEDKRQVICAL